jgi:hypothetical protein
MIFGTKPPASSLLTVYIRVSKTRPTCATVSSEEMLEVLFEGLDG